jgi:hypothetical protein
VHRLGERRDREGAEGRVECGTVDDEGGRELASDVGNFPRFRDGPAARIISFDVTESFTERPHACPMSSTNARAVIGGAAGRTHALPLASFLSPMTTRPRATSGR